MNATEKEIVITFLRTVRRHALGQVAACDKLLSALGVACSEKSCYTSNDVVHVETTPAPAGYEATTTPT